MYMLRFSYLILSLKSLLLKWHFHFSCHTVAQVNSSCAVLCWYMLQCELFYIHCESVRATDKVASGSYCRNATVDHLMMPLRITFYIFPFFLFFFFS